jgi:hypothetical protein
MLAVAVRSHDVLSVGREIVDEGKAILSWFLRRLTGRSVESVYHTPEYVDPAKGAMDGDVSFRRPLSCCVNAY